MTYFGEVASADFQIGKLLRNIETSDLQELFVNKFDLRSS